MSRALVVSGGGCKGAYAVGVAKVLMNEGSLAFDVVCGTSTGGLVAPFVIANRMDLAESLYTGVKTSDILKFRTASQILKAPSFATYKPLYDKLGTVVPDIWPAVQSSPSRLFVTATRLEDRQSVFFHNLTAPDVEELQFEAIPDEETLRLAMLATASVPGVAPPVVIGGNHYVDGGVRENTPLKVPVATRVQEIWVILLSPRTSTPDDGPYTKLLEVLGRTADCLTTDVSTNDIAPIPQAAALKKLFDGVASSISHDTALTGAQVREQLAAANPALAALANTTFHVIAPKESLTGNPLDFDPTAMKAMVATGEADGRAALIGS